MDIEVVVYNLFRIFMLIMIEVKMKMNVAAGKYVKRY